MSRGLDEYLRRGRVLGGDLAWIAIGTRVAFLFLFTGPHKNHGDALRALALTQMHHREPLKVASG